MRAPQRPPLPAGAPPRLLARRPASPPQWRGWIVASVRRAGWAPIAVFAAHVAASRLLGTYLAFPALDVPMHLAGGAAIGYFFWCSLRVDESLPIVGSLNATAAALLSLAATGTATLVWELAEWLSDRYLGSRAQLGLDDTLLDMALGLGGGLALLLAAAARGAPGSRRAGG